MSPEKRQFSCRNPTVASPGRERVKPVAEMKPDAEMRPGILLNRRLSKRSLLHGHGLGQVAGLVHIATPLQRDVVGQQLQRHGS